MRKKLLFITHQLSRTGAPIVFLDMIRICHDAGYEITLISLLEGELREEYEALGIPVRIKEDFFLDRESFRPYAESFDAVICNTLVAYQPILVLNGSKTPVVWWIHEGEQYFEYFKSVLPDFAKLQPNIHVYAVSHYVQEVIRRRYHTETPILHFGVKDHFDGSEKQRVPAQPVRFVISGTYSMVKAQDVLCKAIRLLPTETLDRCEFLFCGSETMADEAVFGPVCDLADRFPNIRHLSSLPHQEMLSLMEEMDFLIVPSRVDPVPTVAVEAQMFRKPCIITDVCGVSHYLKDGENALLCPPEDPGQLAEKIREAIRLLSDDPEAYETMCQRSRAVYDAHFSFDVFTPRIKTIFEELTREPAGKLIFAVGVYDILDIFTYELIPAFEGLGYETFLLDTKYMMQSLGRLYDFIQTPVKACITFNNLAFNTELTPGQNLWEALGIPVINILMDHPFCHKAALDTAPSNAVVLCPDRNHMRYLQRFYPQISTVGFLAHGGKLLPDRLPKPLKERTTDILYAGGISRKFAYEMMPDFSKYDFDAKGIAEDAYQAMLADPFLTTEDAIEAQVLSRGISLSDQELCTLIEELHYIDLLIVSHFREKVIRTIAEAGFSVILYGTGWEVCDWIKDCPSLDYRGRISANEIVEKMQDTKLVLSTMTWFKDGTHDRVFNGMLSGAMTATDSSVYMKETFTGYDGENADTAELLMFELTEIDTLPEKIRALFDAPDVMQRIADQGRKKALEGHTWQSRARELAEDLLPCL